MTSFHDQPATLVEEASAELSSLFATDHNKDQIPLISSTSDDSSQSSSDEEASSSSVLDLHQIQAVPQSLYPATIDPVREFPISCLKLVRTLPGNNRCIDCGEANPQWASISFGVLLCLNCSGRHRSLGVSVSKVRSIMMDSWSQSQVLSMLEGGNSQLAQFFNRHSLGSEDCRNRNIDATNCLASSTRKITNDDIVAKRYKTKAAKFYRDNLAKHVEKVMNNGEYQGREASRRLRSSAKR